MVIFTNKVGFHVACWVGEHKAPSFPSGFFPNRTVLRAALEFLAMENSVLHRNQGDSLLSFALSNATLLNFTFSAQMFMQYKNQTWAGLNLSANRVLFVPHALCKTDLQPGERRSVCFCSSQEKVL